MSGETALLAEETKIGDLGSVMEEVGRAARAAAAELGQTTPAAKTEALEQAAASLRDRRAEILAANARDMTAAEGKGLTPALLDRLALNPDRVESMAKGLEEVARFPDPVGRILEERERPNGLKIAKVSVPLGVIGIIYESRPNVTADAAGLCLKAGNAAILRGGSESFHSSSAILESLQEGLAAAGLPQAAAQRVPTSDRAAVGLLLTMNEYVDVIVPRGGKGLIERVFAESRIPVLAHLEGLCHTYVDRSAALAMARTIVVNAKMRRTGICGATETLLIDRPVVESHLPAILEDLFAAGCAVRGDAAAQALDGRIVPAEEKDWVTEYLAPVISVRVVDGIDQAVDHINVYGSNHTDAIVADDQDTAERFLARVDSGIVMHNTSTQYADGGEFGMGAEIGISTGKLHARGPVGAEQLTSHKYLVRGQGQVRP